LASPYFLTQRCLNRLYFYIFLRKIFNVILYNCCCLCVKSICLKTSEWRSDIVYTHYENLKAYVLCVFNWQKSLDVVQSIVELFVQWADVCLVVRSVVCSVSVQLLLSLPFFVPLWFCSAQRKTSFFLFFWTRLIAWPFTASD
jgi:hypothetical protein